MNQPTFCILTMHSKSNPGDIITMVGGVDAIVNMGDRQEVAEMVSNITNRAENVDLEDYLPESLLMVGPNGSAGTFKVDERLHELLYTTLLTTTKENVEETQSSGADGFLLVSVMSVSKISREEKGSLGIDSLIAAFNKNRDNTVN